MCLSRLPSSRPSWTSGDSGRRALIGSPTTGSGSYSTPIRLERLRGDVRRCPPRRWRRHRPCSAPCPHRAQHRPVQMDQAVNVLAGHIAVRQDGAHAGQRPGLLRCRSPGCGRADRPRAGSGRTACRGRCSRRRNLARPVTWSITSGTGSLTLTCMHRLGDDRVLDGQRRFAAQRLGRRMDGILDGRVAGAAAVGILERDRDVVVGGVGVAVQQGGGGHDQARRAEAALHGAVFDEGFLQRVECSP